MTARRVKGEVRPPHSLTLSSGGALNFALHQHDLPNCVPGQIGKQGSTAEGINRVGFKRDDTPRCSAADAIGSLDFARLTDPTTRSTGTTRASAREEDVLKWVQSVATRGVGQSSPETAGQNQSVRTPRKVSCTSSDLRHTFRVAAPPNTTRKMDGSGQSSELVSCVSQPRQMPRTCMLYPNTKAGSYPWSRIVLKSHVGSSAMEKVISRAHADLNKAYAAFKVCNDQRSTISAKNRVLEARNRLARIEKIHAHQVRARVNI